MFERISAVATVVLLVWAGPAYCQRTGAQAVAAQKAILAAADAHDGAYLEAAMAPQFVMRFGIVEGGRIRWGETNRDRLVRRWTQNDPDALPTLVSAQRAVVDGASATVFACIIDRSKHDGGRVALTFSRVMDSFSWTGRRWLWIASMEIQVESCPA